MKTLTSYKDRRVVGLFEAAINTIEVLRLSLFIITDCQDIHLFTLKSYSLIDSVTGLVSYNILINSLHSIQIDYKSAEA